MRSRKLELVNLFGSTGLEIVQNTAGCCMEMVRRLYRDAPFLTRSRGKRAVARTTSLTASRVRASSPGISFGQGYRASMQLKKQACWISLSDHKQEELS